MSALPNLTSATMSAIFSCEPPEAQACFWDFPVAHLGLADFSCRLFLCMRLLGLAQDALSSPVQIAECKFVLQGDICCPRKQMAVFQCPACSSASCDWLYCNPTHTCWLVYQLVKHACHTTMTGINVCCLAAET